MKAVNYIAFVLLYISSSLALAQDTLSPKIEMVGRAQKDQVILRWAANDPLVWKYSNKYGMKLERYTILRDGKVLDVPEKKVFPVFKPLPLEQWEALSENDDYVLVAAQAIYGETFEVTENFSSDIAQALSQTKEMEQRHYFALFAADVSKKVAEASGLLYEDREVKKNEKYLYTIVSMAPREVMVIDTGFVYLGLDEYFELPKPEGLHAEAVDSSVMISWEGKRFKEFYNSYIVERSDDDGRTFFSISKEPIVNPLLENGEHPEYIFKGDSVSLNKKYLYRVKGINPFGEVSPPSEVVSVICLPKLVFTPRIQGSKVMMNGSMYIQWEFPKEGVDSIQGFKLKRSNKVKGEYKEINSKISPKDTSVIDLTPLSSNYYIITAYDKYGNETSSMPSLAMLVDSIPPVPPVNIVGEIDTLGIVRLSWSANLEEDLAGYRVYRSSFATKEFVQISSKMLKKAEYVDTIEIVTLTKNIYYKIIAVDGHFNPSDFSVMLKLERPDVVPPVSPQFKSIVADDKGIHLTWVNSSSDDVEKSILYRRSSSESGWMPIFTTPFTDAITAYSDNESQSGQMYEYTLIAIDFKGLESKPAVPVARKRLASSTQAEIKNVSAKADRTNNSIDLSWQYQAEGVSKYLIYRAQENGAIELYKEIGGAELTFKDADLKTNTVYKYRLQARFKNGALSPFSKELIVNY